jgi:hypothetical protein
MMETSCTSKVLRVRSYRSREVKEEHELTMIKFYSSNLRFLASLPAC